ncbi:M23 family metallopeptidase [Nitrosophilus kaiyonis]|uniref:M23 family metallopeptidase n=1 Tax=Nitrosophilus kaiyonis TaxID=2930200 RepID=UPI00249381D9|nr:M23 family metallopeptidase [Nitrosophilus kaiyonis]
MRRKGNKFKILTILFLIAIVGIGGYIYTSKDFERVKPTIEIVNKIYWNMKKPIEVVLKDNVGIKSYKITMNDGKNEQVVAEAELEKPVKLLTIPVDAPKVGMLFESNKAIINIEVTDNSKWNYFRGNRASKKVYVIIDRKKPSQYVIANSYKIRKGGCATVIFKSTDDNLKDVYILTNFGKKFIPQPFYKKGYYISLIAWPIQEKNFRAYIVSEDLAGNRAKTYIRYFLQDKKYKKSKIDLKRSFLEGKVSDIANEFAETAKMSDLEKFKFVNETLRNKNEKLIHDITSKVFNEKVDNFNIKPFYPLKNAAAVASFGDHRYYYYKGKFVSESYHLGLDLASTKMAPIIASNDGKVVYADYNGIYGNMPIIYHGLGLYTLYGHCSELRVKKGDDVKRGDVIAKTGLTGLALGDHLHFGILVQGVEVLPSEWMDKRWIKLNVVNVIKDAKKLIDMEK